MLRLGRLGGVLGRLGVAPGGLAPALRLIASASSLNNANVTVPAAAAIGDLAILLDGSTGTTTAPTAVVPSNWVEDANVFLDAATAGRAIISHRILEAGEPGAAVTGMDSTSDRKLVLVFRPRALLASVTASTPTGEFTASNPAAQSILASGASVPDVLSIAHWRATGLIDPRTVSPAMKQVVGADERQWAGWSLGRVDRSIDIDDEGVNALQGLFYELEFAA